ncbi:MAG TPA: ATP-binding protein [Solirubrobacteraceae bacterium]|jgi:serine/threonine-protein kinase RsbW|nr:ATP-binding protein [Solirubrobacteraceae bacterium]
MAEIPNVRLSLSNRPENVLVVRQALTGVADSLGLDAIETNDLNTAVTEACNNVVLHAYAGEEGPLEVDVYALADGLAVAVRDRGSGIRLRPPERDSDDVRSGIGVPVINALSRHAEFKDLDGGGTEVRMEFAASKATALERLDGNGRGSVGGARTQCASTVELSVAPTALARAVLPRVLSVLAARAHFSTDRISDVQLVADLLAASAFESISGSHLDVGVMMAPRNLELRIGSLRAGHGESLVAAGAEGLAPVIERLTDARRVARADSGETLELTLVDRR